MYIPITLNAGLELFKNDDNNKYLSEKNQDFLEETGLIKCYRYNDLFLRPYGVFSCDYDLICASNNTTTLFKYDINYRNYYLVTQGQIKVYLAPPKSKKYLYENSNYENFEFTSPLNPWNIQTKYKTDFDKIKGLIIDLNPGSMLYIPAFWWYSFKFIGETSVSCFKYKTYMNILSNSPKYFMQLLQCQNIKRTIAKKVVINNENNENNENNKNNKNNENN
jgi:hypothetical protein